MANAPEPDAPLPLPADPGTYVLVLALARTRTVTIGRMGRFELATGCYAYVGSAFGSGGLRARIRHHLEPAPSPHWHIDYLTAVAEPVEVWYSVHPRKLEREWAELLGRLKPLRPAIARFGASEYRRARTTHLYHARRKPSFNRFRALLDETFAPDLELRRLALDPPRGG
jgi:Uri superfamily endonuclease